MGLLGIQDRECFAVRMYVEHAVALEIPSTLPGFGRRRLRHLYRYEKISGARKQDQKIIFAEILIFLCSF
jgi:hypothetical protein